MKQDCFHFSQHKEICEKSSITGKASKRLNEGEVRLELKWRHSNTPSCNFLRHYSNWACIPMRAKGKFKSGKIALFWGKIQVGKNKVVSRGYIFLNHPESSTNHWEVSEGSLASWLYVFVTVPATYFRVSFSAFHSLRVCSFFLLF